MTKNTFQSIKSDTFLIRTSVSVTVKLVSFVTPEQQQQQQPVDCIFSDFLDSRVLSVAARLSAAGFNAQTGQDHLDGLIYFHCSPGPCPPGLMLRPGESWTWNK